MRRWRVILAVAFLLIMGTGGTGWWYIRSRAQAPRQLAEIESKVRVAWQHVTRQLIRWPGPSERPMLLASGFIEAQETIITSEVAAQILCVTRKEGEQVQSGELLIQLDDALLEAQISEAEAAVEIAQARLARAKRGLPPSQISRLEASVTRAEIAHDWARVALEDTAAIREDPQELAVQIAESQALARALDHQLKQALAMKDAAEIAKNELSQTVTWLRGGFDVDVPVPGGGTVSRHIEVSEHKIGDVQDQLDAATTQWWQAWIGVNTTASSRDWAQAALADLFAIRDSPQELQTEMDLARARHEQTEAAVRVAEAQLALAAAAISEEELAVAEAQVARARSAYDALAAQHSKRRLEAPTAGRVVERMVQEGETIAAGTPLMALANLDSVTLTLYIPVADIAGIKVGQPMSVTVDSYPQRQFVGKIAHIATAAEFTPRNVQTHAERAGMVFAVRVELPNPDAALKPGMTADAMLEVGGTGY